MRFNHSSLTLYPLSQFESEAVVPSVDKMLAASILALDSSLGDSFHAQIPLPAVSMELPRDRVAVATRSGGSVGSVCR